MRERSRFISNYDNYFNSEPILKTVDVNEQAFDLVKSKNSFSDFRTLLDNYSILQKVDTDGNTLLQRAVMSNNYILTKFLLIRGADATKLNVDLQTACDIAEEQENDKILKLFKNAGVR